MNTRKPGAREMEREWDIYNVYYARFVGKHRKCLDRRDGGVSMENVSGAQWDDNDYTPRCVGRETSWRTIPSVSFKARRFSLSPVLCNTFLARSRK